MPGCFSKRTGWPIAASGLMAAWAMTAAGQVSESVLHSFASPPAGANAFSGLIRDSAGNLYGTTGSGGADNAGAIYKLSSKGKLTVLYSFTGGADGSGPRSGVIRDSAGNLYGTTVYGGSWGAGVIYELSAAGQLTALYSFTGGDDGAYPFAGVIQDSSGNLYGTTAYGGSGQTHQGNGVAFMWNATAQLTVLHTFAGGADGAYPYGGLARDPAGNLYGTTYSGGGAGQGTVFKIDTPGNETILYSFTGAADGGNPQSGLILDSGGNLYGTAFDGGTAGDGVVFKLAPAGQQTVLHNFLGGSDGANPYAGVVGDSSGNLYGTTIYGGAARAGVVYKVTAAGTEKVLYSFTGGADGSNPYGGVIRTGSGVLYGTSAYGGTAGLGNAFELNGGVETVLAGFPQSAGGFSPNSGVLVAAGGNLYGATALGGAHGAGTVYKLTAAGRQTVLYSFTGGADGNGPDAGVVRDAAGNLYGTTFMGGAGSGVVFMVDKSGAETVLYTFSGGTDGANPYGGLVSDAAGDLYGTTWFGGANGAGVIYKVAAGGGESVLYNFTGGLGAGRAYSALAVDAAGDLFGTCYACGANGFGAVFELAANGQFTTLYSFTGGNDGRYPYAGVTLDSVGNLYGTTEVGGAPYAGVIYEISSAGVFSVLYSFTGGAGGDYPNGGVVRDASGNLYGTTVYGGLYGAGMVYEYSTASGLTVLYNFTGAADGANPDAGVARDASGNLYGTTQAGGTGNVGTVFKVSGAGGN